MGKDASSWNGNGRSTSEEAQRYLLVIRVVDEMLVIRVVDRRGNARHELRGECVREEGGERRVERRQRRELRCLEERCREGRNTMRRGEKASSFLADGFSQERGRYLVLRVIDTMVGEAGNWKWRKLEALRETGLFCSSREQAGESTFPDAGTEMVELGTGSSPGKGLTQRGRKLASLHLSALP